MICPMFTIKITDTEPRTFPATSNLFQTPFWGEFKKRGGQLPLYFWVELSYDNDGVCSNIIFPLLVFIRKLFSESSEGNLYAYIPRLPNFPRGGFENNIFLEEFSEALRPHLPQNCILIKYDLSSFSDYARETEESLRKDLVELKMNYGTKNHNFYKSVTNYLCADTVIINLALSPERLVKNMRQQTRNSIRRAYKEEVCFSIFTAQNPGLKAALTEWHKIYCETAERKKFYSEKLPYFEMLFDTFVSYADAPQNCSQEKKGELIPMNTLAPVPEFFLFTASKDKSMLSGLILAICGQRAYYMYAASRLQGRECMPNYGLQWEVICFARSRGCTEYDLMGIPPNNDKANAMAGLYIFKTGFGGKKIHFDGTWDYPLDIEEYEKHRRAEYLSLRI